MKMNLRKAIASALLSAGAMIPLPALGAELNTNLLVDPGFENVDPDVTVGGYGAARILSWTDGTDVGFAYPHGDFSGPFGGPDYANGAPLAGGGAYYFTSNASDATQPDITTPGQLAQSVDLSSGPVADAIAAGSAHYRLSAFFSSYSTNGDFGLVQADFLDGAGAMLGTAQIADGDTTTWSSSMGSGAIPVGTASALISVYAEALSGGPDGYVDNLDFRVVPEPGGFSLVVLAGLPLLRRRWRA